MTDDRDAPPFSPTIALLTIARTVEVRVAASLEPHGLTLRKYGLLGHIAGAPGISLSELARRSGITVQSVHALISALSEAGYVRSLVEHAGQAAQISVTRKGSGVLADVAADVRDLDAELFSASDGMREVAAALASTVPAPAAPPQD